MNKEELKSLKRKSLELKDCRKELELYKIALKLACKDNIVFEYCDDCKKAIRSSRNFYINTAKAIKGYEL